jgi:hypothetical protein
MVNISQQEHCDATDYRSLIVSGLPPAKLALRRLSLPTAGATGAASPTPLRTLVWRISRSGALEPRF